MVNYSSILAIEKLESNIILGIAYNDGPVGQCFKTLSQANLLPLKGKNLILRYKNNFTAVITLYVSNLQCYNCIKQNDDVCVKWQ
jgi:hypothetical protein